MIELIGLEKTYTNHSILKDVNVTVNDGDVISIIGPSGSGKSTLIRCINMLEKPTGGKILLDGVDITAPGYDVTQARRRMGMVFQSFNLFGHLTVIENVMIAPMDILKKSKQEAYETGMALLKRVGMEGREFKYPDQLSGGQKQRVAIARTLAMDPQVILFDEPTSALDPTMVGEVQAVIKDLAETGRTMLIVTHEMKFARSICSRVFYIDQHTIYEEGTPEQIFDHPQKELTRRFIRQLKVFEFQVDRKDIDFDEIGMRIDRYCLENGIGAWMKYRIRLAVDETLQQLLAHLLGVTPVNVSIEFDPSESRASVNVSYGGERFDPADSQQEFSYMVLSRTSDGISYSYDPDREYANCIKVLIEDSGKEKIA